MHWLFQPSLGGAERLCGWSRDRIRLFGCLLSYLTMIGVRLCWHLGRRAGALNSCGWNRVPVAGVFRWPLNAITDGSWPQIASISVSIRRYCSSPPAIELQFVWIRFRAAELRLQFPINHVLSSLLFLLICPALPCSWGRFGCVQHQPQEQPFPKSRQRWKYSGIGIGVGVIVVVVVVVIINSSGKSLKSFSGYTFHIFWWLAPPLSICPPPRPPPPPIPHHTEQRIPSGNSPASRASPAAPALTPDEAVK